MSDTSPLNEITDLAEENDQQDNQTPVVEQPQPEQEAEPLPDAQDTISLDTPPLLTMVREEEEEEETYIDNGPSAETRILTRKLSETAPIETPSLLAAQVSHLGAIRERNEDSSLILNAQMAGHFSQIPFGLYMVADGMGGHMNGHEASNLAIRVVTRQIINRIYLPMMQNTSGPPQAPVQEVLVQAVEAANDAIFSPDPDLDGGTTLTIALMIGRRLHVAHVGDSRAYLLHGDQFDQITDDHSLIRRLQDVGQLPADDPAFLNMRHVLLRAVGQGDELEVDTYTLRLPATGRLLLCSDGLSGLLTDSEMKVILQKSIPPTETADLLCQAALQAGGHDNITAVIVDFNL